MLEDLELEEITINHPSLDWQANFNEVFGGPVEVLQNNKILLKNHRFYVDDLSNEYAVINKQRNFHKGGNAVVLSEGYFPFGSELAFTQTCRFAMNFMRVTFDLKWYPGIELKRHFGLGSVNLPGKFKRYWVMPPALHIIEKKSPCWIEIDDEVVEKKMIGHWHRPPLAIVFEREDGTMIEVGCGSDIWRWEENLGAGIEMGSYKIFVTPEGIEYDCEPLMTCTPFSPESRPYRFTWYYAWGDKSMLKAKNIENCQDITFDKQGEFTVPECNGEAYRYKVDFSKISWKESCCHSINEESKQTPCWEHEMPQKIARKIVRKLQALPEKDGSIYVIKGIKPSVCQNGSHVNRPKNNTIHWDINSLLDLIVWQKQQLGNNWQIHLEVDEDLPLLSLRGADLPLGFSLDEVIDNG